MRVDFAKGKSGPRSMNYSCLLFDLDGTLVDSRADLVTSVNLTLEEMGLLPIIETSVMRFVGEGVHLLIERSLRAGLGRDPDQAEVHDALGRYQRHYREHLLDQTRPYPEVEAILEHFSHLPKAVVTNKPLDFSVMLLDGLSLTRHFRTIIGGDSLLQRKPSPAPPIEAAKRCQSDPRDCLMIGDSRVDIEAGRAAGMTTCGFLAGFRGRAELENAEADILIETFGQLRQVVEG